MSHFQYLPDATVRAIHAAAIDVELSSDENQIALLAGLDAAFRAQILALPRQDAQLLNALFFLNGIPRLADRAGTVPIELWLNNAIHLSQLRQEQAVFQAALVELQARKAAPDPAAPAAASPAKPPPAAPASSPPEPPVAAPPEAPRPPVVDTSGGPLAQQIRRIAAERARAEAAGEDVSELRRALRELKQQALAGAELLPGATLHDGRFVLIAPLGSGGFGTVWKARDHEQDTLVAIKVLHAHLVRDPTRVERFFRGARKMSELAHQHICKIVMPRGKEEHGETVFHFFIMEYCAGGDLRRAVLARTTIAGPLAPGAALRWLLEAGDALAHLHEKHLLHRDVSPDNILLAEDGSGRLSARLADFDLVRADDTFAGTNDAMGKFLYASPEALRSVDSIDERADVYSLAMTAAFAISGAELPPEALYDRQTFLRRLKCSPSIWALLSKATDPDREKRLASVGLLCGRLRRILDARGATRVAIWAHDTALSPTRLLIIAAALLTGATAPWWWPALMLVAKPPPSRQDAAVEAGAEDAPDDADSATAAGEDDPGEPPVPPSYAASVVVQDPLAKPFRWMVHIDDACTGFLVGRRSVITRRYCTRESGDVIKPRMMVTGPLMGPRGVVVLKWSWATLSSTDDDSSIAVLHFPSPLPEASGFELKIAAHPLPPNFTSAFYLQGLLRTAEVENRTPATLGTHTDLLYHKSFGAGSGGAPLFTREGNTWKVIGVHLGSSVDRSGRGTAMTEIMVSRLRELIEQSEVDQQP